MMSTNTIKWNSEIWRKILNSVADKYDCGVRFCVHEGRLDWEGDRACAMEIVREAMALMGAQNH
ncbi:MAG: hypothetical protein HKP58_02140 [Desulfatitalea sp.]|nr:hypothetical protein [Desulfatitalea sp.]NNJ99189.1 hypothetical protein [Desulfatitalea sp.]